MSFFLFPVLYDLAETQAKRLPALQRLKTCFVLSFAEADSVRFRKGEDLEF
jgi:hypothetical protein